MPGLAGTIPSRPWMSFAPGILDDLYAVLTAGFATNPDVAVHDGQWVSGGSEATAVVVGWAGFVAGYQRPFEAFNEQQLGAAVTSATVAEGLTPAGREQLEIQMAILHRTGDAKQAALSAGRRLTYGYATQVASYLHPPYPGGVPRMMMGSSSSFHMSQDRRGPMLVLSFSIHAEGYAQQ